jgi:hypothetical protein
LAYLIPSSPVCCSFIPVVHDLIPSLPYVIPSLSSRLSPTELVEPSEEIRLLMVSLLTSIVERAGAVYSPGVEETVKILSQTLIDSYPEVKKVSITILIPILILNSQLGIM